MTLDNDIDSTFNQPVVLENLINFLQKNHSYLSAIFNKIGSKTIQKVFLYFNLFQIIGYIKHPIKNKEELYLFLYNTNNDLSNLINNICISINNPKNKNIFKIIQNVYKKYDTMSFYEVRSNFDYVFSYFVI